MERGTVPQGSRSVRYLPGAAAVRMLVSPGPEMVNAAAARPELLQRKKQFLKRQRSLRRDRHGTGRIDCHERISLNRFRDTLIPIVSNAALVSNAASLPRRRSSAQPRQRSRGVQSPLNMPFQRAHQKPAQVLAALARPHLAWVCIR